MPFAIRPMGLVGRYNCDPSLHALEMQTQKQLGLHLHLQDLLGGLTVTHSFFSLSFKGEKHCLELEKHTRSNLPQAPYIHEGIEHQNKVLETAFLN